MNKFIGVFMVISTIILVSVVVANSRNSARYDATPKLRYAPRSIDHRGTYIQENIVPSMDWGIETGGDRRGYRRDSYNDYDSYRRDDYDDYRRDDRRDDYDDYRRDDYDTSYQDRYQDRYQATTPKPKVDPLAAMGRMKQSKQSKPKVDPLAAMGSAATANKANKANKANQGKIVTKKSLKTTSTSAVAASGKMFKQRSVDRIKAGSAKYDQIRKPPVKTKPTIVTNMKSKTTSITSSFKQAPIKLKAFDKTRSPTKARSSGYKVKKAPIRQSKQSRQRSSSKKRR